MNRKGFTLIELLIVVVIIGILAAIAIPKFANTKEKAYIASMKSDLHHDRQHADGPDHWDGHAGGVDGAHHEPEHHEELRHLCRRDYAAGTRGDYGSGRRTGLPVSVWT